MIEFLKTIYYCGPVHRLLFRFAQAYKVFTCQQCYKKNLKRIRSKYQAGEKINVVFLADDPSKWKYQPVYDLLAKSSHFRPMVVVGLRKNHTFDLSCLALRDWRQKTKEFYEGHGCQCLNGFHVPTKTLVNLRDLGADIVFYQEPWMLWGLHDVRSVAKTALTGYVPYSVEWEYDPKLHWQYNFHRLLYYNFSWNQEQAEQEKPRGPFTLCSRIIGVGHTSFDAYLAVSDVKDRNLVIYAPHFAFPFSKTNHAEILGTFEWNGREMLAYAKKHPEIEWVWKPHPGLRWQLEGKGFMTHQEVDDYYAQWEKIGRACYDGDYFNLFQHSRAMITDCGSFLLEYAPTGMPIIRLLAEKFSLKPSVAAQQIFDTYYTAHSWNELERYLDEIVVGRMDPNREARVAAIKHANLIGHSASQQVVDCMVTDLSAKKDNQ